MTVAGRVELASLSAIESRLSDETPFGSYQFLSEGLWAVYFELLRFLAEHSCGAKKLMGALDRSRSHGIMVRDPLVRRTVEDGACTILQGLDAIDTLTLDEVLSAAAENAMANKGSLLDATARCIPLGSKLDHGYVWADDEPQTTLACRFVEEVLKRLPGFRIQIPTDNQVQILIAGHRLASQVAPALVRSATSHLVAVIIGDFHRGQPPINALTVPGLPGVIVLSPEALSSSAAVAETLVHESLHLKFLDIDYVHPLFAIGFRPHSSPRVTPVWHEHDQRFGDWPIDRLLTSMHVYLSLAIFFGIAANRQGDGLYARDDCLARVDGCRTRATWLFETAQDYLEYLSPKGREFITWIGAMLTELDASPIQR